MPEFFETPIGRTYYEHTLPELIKAINRFAKAIDRLADVLERIEPRLGKTA